MKKKILFYITLIVLTLIFIISAQKIINWYLEGKHTNELLDEINKKIEIIDGNEQSIVTGNATDDIKKNLVSIDVNKLKKLNNDVVGYIKVNNTSISYPVVQTINNDYYLTHSFDKSNNSAGWVFMDYQNNSNDFDNNTIIYAHGRLDNTMFGSLKKVIKKEWFTNVDNYVIDFSTEYYDSLWQVFSVYKIKTTNDYLKIYFDSNYKYENFINMITERSIYEFPTKVDIDDKILTLSSCYNDSEKVVLHAKLIKYNRK